MSATTISRAFSLAEAYGLAKPRFVLNPSGELIEIPPRIGRSSQAVTNRYVLENRFASMGVPFIRRVDHFRAAADEGPFHLLTRDPHCHPVGCRVTARALADYIEEMDCRRGCSSVRRRLRRLSSLASFEKTGWKPMLQRLFVALE